MVSDIEPQSRVIKTIFIGGGTPSLFDGKYIINLFQQLQDKLEINQNAEITMEVNPNSLNLRNLNQYLKAGVNRLSIGAQSFDQAKLKSLGRIHNSQQITESFTAAKVAGFNNINLDLMFGLPKHRQFMTWNWQLI